MRQLIENMDDEVRCDYLVKAEMKKIWNIQLNMAVKLLEVCNKYNLRIVADSGTALGVVRHQGFIPWDDDMDFRMPRKDYDKLLEIASKEFQHPYFFQTCYSDKGYFLNFAKLRCNNTAMILRLDVLAGAKYHQGIDIDIFPDDYLPNSDQAIDKLIDTKVLISNYINFRNSLRNLWIPSRCVGLVRNALTLKQKAFWSDSRLMKFVDSTLADKEKKNLSKMGLIAFMQSYRPRCVINSNLYDSIILLPFENTKLPVFSNFDELLTTEYGDWRKLVKGECSHHIMVVDPDKSYTEYLNKVRPSFYSQLKRSLKSIHNRLSKILHKGK